MSSILVKCNPSDAPEFPAIEAFNLRHDQEHGAGEQADFFNQI